MELERAHGALVENLKIKNNNNNNNKTGEGRQVTAGGVQALATVPGILN